MNNSKHEIQLESVAATLKAMANSRRLMILQALEGGEKNVTDIVSVMDISQSPTSQHLKVLRDAGLVKTRRESTTIYYSIASDVVAAVMAAIGEEGQQ